MEKPELRERIVTALQARGEPGDRRTVIIVLQIAIVGAAFLAAAGVNRWQMILLELILVPCLILAWRGFLLPGRSLAPLATLILFSFLIFQHQGVRDTAMLGLAVVLITGGLLLGRFGTLLFGALSLITIAVLGIREALGMQPVLMAISNTLADYIAVSLSLVIITVIQWLLIGRLNASLQKSRESEAAAKRASEALRSSSGTMLALLNALPDTIFRFSADGVFESFIPSRDFRAMIPPDQFLGRPIEAVLPEELSREARALIQLTLSSGQKQTLRYSLPGEKAPGFYEARFVPASETSVMCVVRDISDQIKIESERELLLKTLKRRNSQLQTAAEVARRCVSILDPHRLVIESTNLIGAGFNLYYVGLFLLSADGKNAVLQAGTGAAGREMLAEGHHLSLDHPSMIAWCINNRTARIAQHAELDAVRVRNPHLPDTRSEMAIPLISRNHVIGALTIQSQIENDFQEEDVATIQAMTDQLAIAIDNARLFAAVQTELSERQRAERALQQERDFAVQVMSALGQGVTVTDAHSRFEYVNPAYAYLLGFTPGELIGKQPLDLTHPDDHETIIQARERRRAGEVTTYETRLVHRDGSLVDVLLTGAPRWQEGKIVGSITVATDLTERKRAEQERETLIRELSAKNAELERFTYTVSHDLKSPLVTIRGFVGYLERDIASGNMDQLRTDIQRITSAASRMEQLLDELLEISRVGRKMNPPAEVPFAEIVQEALGLTEGRLHIANVQVTVGADLPSVYGDRVRLVEVVQNLVDNAAKFMGPQAQPRIEIGARRDGQQTVFFVRDNGIGIDPKFHDKVFGLFDKLDPRSDGTGVGLALVKRIVEVHGGRVWVESDGRGHGSTFCFTLAPAPAGNN